MTFKNGHGMALAGQFVGEEVEPLRLVEQQHGVAAAMGLGIALPQRHLVRLRRQHQASHAGAQIGPGQRLAGTGSFPGTDGTEHMHPGAGVTQGERVLRGEIQQRRV